MSLKFKAPFEEVHETGEYASKFDDLIIYDDEYYSKYVRENIGDAEIINLSDYIEERSNPPKLEELQNPEAVEYYVDLLLYTGIDTTKEEVFREIVKHMSTGHTNMDVACEAILKVGNSHYASLAFYSFYDQQFYDNTLRYMPIYAFDTVLEPNLINDSLETIREKVLELMTSGKAKFVYLYEVEMDDPFNEMWDTTEHKTYLAFNFLEKFQIKKLSTAQVHEKCLELLKNKDMELYGTFQNGNNTHIGFINNISQQ